MSERPHDQERTSDAGSGDDRGDDDATETAGPPVRKEASPLIPLLAVAGAIAVTVPVLCVHRERDEEYVEARQRAAEARELVDPAAQRAAYIERLERWAKTPPVPQLVDGAAIGFAAGVPAESDVAPIDPIPEIEP